MVFLQDHCLLTEIFTVDWRIKEVATEAHWSGKEKKPE